MMLEVLLWALIAFTIVLICWISWDILRNYGVLPSISVAILGLTIVGVLSIQMWEGFYSEHIDLRKDEWVCVSKSTTTVYVMAGKAPVPTKVTKCNLYKRVE